MRISYGELYVNKASAAAVERFSVDKRLSLPRPTVMLTICAATSSFTAAVAMVIVMTTTVNEQVHET